MREGCNSVRPGGESRFESGGSFAPGVVKREEEISTGWSGPEVLRLMYEFNREFCEGIVARRQIVGVQLVAEMGVMAAEWWCFGEL